MILAAGFGTRLRPLTYERAKPAIPLLGVSLIERVIQNLRKASVDGFRINLHHLPQTVRDAVNGNLDVASMVSFSFEPNILGTAGGLKANESFFNNGTFIMANADIVFDFDLIQAIRFHRQNNCLATLAVTPQEPPFKYYPIRIDSSGGLLNFKGTRPGGPAVDQTYVFTGIHILEPEVFKYIPPHRFCEINDEVYPRAMDEGAKIRAVALNGYWSDLGTPAAYLKAQSDLLRNMELPIYIAPEVKVAPEVRIGPNVSICSGVELEAGASIENSIVWENAKIRGDTAISGSILGAGVEAHGSIVNKILTTSADAEI